MEEARRQFAALRRQAEALLPKVEVATESLSREALQLLVEELRVHQVELELQHQDLLLTQQALEASRDRYVELFDFAPVGYVTIDEDGIIVEVNRTACRMLGAARNELPGRKLALFVKTSDQETYYTCYRQLIFHEAPASCEAQFVRADRSLFWGRLEGEPRPGENGENHARITIHDVSEQKQMANALRQRETFLRSIYQGIDIPIYLLDVLETGEFTFAGGNPALERVSGRSATTINGRQIHELEPPLEEIVADRALAHYQQCLATGKPVEYEQRLEADGEEAWWFIHLDPLRDDGGRIYRLVATAIDITDRKRMEQELRQAQTELEGRVAELTYTHAMLVEEAEEREQAQEKLQQRNQELAMLNSTMAAVSSSLELENVAATLQRSLSNEMNVAGGAILFYDPAREQLAMQAQWELPPALAAACNTLPVAGSPLEPVIRNKRTLLHEDFREVSLLMEVELDKARPDWRNYLAVPLLAKGEVEGALCLFSKFSAGFSNTQVTFFKILGQQTGIAIQNARLFQQVRRGQQRLRHLAQRVFTAQEKERQRVSRELHDEAGQALTGLKITLEMIRADMDRRTGPIEKSEVGLIQQQLDAAVELCEMTMSQIRTVAHDLRPAALENMGLDMTLRGFCRDFGRRARLPITYQHSGIDLPELPPAVDIALYRFLQETLTNVVKHAGASQARVEFHCDETTLSLTVEDDGSGFDPEAALDVHNKEQGLGLAGMQERLESVGGRLLISSRPGSGTRLVAWIPR